MSTLILCLACLGFYLSHDKYDGQLLSIDNPITNNRKNVKLLSWALLLVGVILECIHWGIGTGMTYASFSITLFISCFILFDRLSSKSIPTILIITLIATLIRQFS